MNRKYEIRRYMSPKRIAVKRLGYKARGDVVFGLASTN